MSKHRFKLTEPFRMPLKVEFDVEFDTETGEADVVSDGRVVLSPDHLRRREINHHLDVDRLDEKAFAKLIEDGVIEAPRPGDTLMLHGDKQFVDIDPEDVDAEDPLSPEDIFANLSPLAEIRNRRLKSARRRGKLSI